MATRQTTLRGIFNPASPETSVVQQRSRAFGPSRFGSPQVSYTGVKPLSWRLPCNIIILRARRRESNNEDVMAYCISAGGRLNSGHRDVDSCIDPTTPLMVESLQFLGAVASLARETGRRKDDSSFVPKANSTAVGVLHSSWKERASTSPRAKYSA